MKLRVLQLTGTPYDMGYQHGLAHADAIRQFAEERVHLSSDPNWTGRSLSRGEVIALAEACLKAHEAYSPALMDELRGMADATGVTPAELLIVNGFTDFIDVVYNVGERINAQPHPSDNCTAFLIPNSATPDGQGFYGQTWDMHATATPFVILLEGRPSDAPAFLAFTTTGCVGQIGMNEHGIAIGINNLMARDGQVGVMWPFVVRKVLMQDNLEDALKCITEAPLAGGHNYQLMDKHGRGYNIEAMGTRYEVTPLEETPVIHTNHCLIQPNRAVERERSAESLASSQKRYSRAGELLQQRPITLETLIDVTRDEDAICVRPVPPMYVESCGAAIMRPATGDFWAVWGLPSENEYEHFTI